MFNGYSRLKVEEINSSVNREEGKIFDYPSGEIKDPVKNMFFSNIQNFGGAPTKGKSYYWDK